MAASKGPRKPKAPSALEGGTPSQVAAHKLLQRFSDLRPSVDRILAAGLDEDETLRALTLFESSLGVIGDPHRNPAVAVEAARAGSVA